MYPDALPVKELVYRRSFTWKGAVVIQHENSTFYEFWVRILSQELRLKILKSTPSFLRSRISAVHRCIDCTKFLKTSFKKLVYLLKLGKGCSTKSGITGSQFSFTFPTLSIHYIAQKDLPPVCHDSPGGS